MKRFPWISIFLILFFSACSSISAGAKCEGGVCIGIEILGPVEALKSTQFVISIKTDKDTSDLGISLYSVPGVTIVDIQKTLERAKLIYQDKDIAHWNIDTKGGEEYKLFGNVTLSKPTVSYGIFRYQVITRAYKPPICNISTSASIYLDAEGKQVETSKLKTLLQTNYPLPTSLPNLTIIPETALPRVTSTTIQPTIMPTSTLAAYPAPDGTPGSESVNKIQPSPMPTLQAYPSP